MQNKQVELLAPAGNPEGFFGAIHAGADAVYLAGSRFGARAYADNFTTEELVHCIRYAHLWGRKVYLTVNTLVKESEFDELYDYLAPFYEVGLDGVIIQDMGVFAYIREHFPDMELHVSTQMTLTGEYGARMLQEMGACRIVPARELSLQEIRHIKEKTGLEIETFIHGAMCYCYSGQCLFSSILGGRSGNRGRCAQPCRLPYRVKNGKGETEECYPLSLKDMCTIEQIPALIEAGIDSFKIEGRMKKPEYTAGVTAIYRKYIDKYYKNEGKPSSSAFKVSEKDLNALSCLYIRSERQDGYYNKHNGKDMVTLSSPAYSGSDEALLADIRKKYLTEKPGKSIGIYADFQTGKQATVTLVLGELAVTAKGNEVQKASRQPISKENIAKQLGKLGDSIFVADTMEITVSDDAFYPLGAINELRRQAVELLEKELLIKNGFPIQRSFATITQMAGEAAETLTNKENVTATDGGFTIALRRIEQLYAMQAWLAEKDNSEYVSRIYVDSDLFAVATDECVKICEEFSKKCEIVLALPYIIRERDADFMEKYVFSNLERFPHIFSGVLIRSAEGMGMVKSRNYQRKIYADAGFYMWNRKALTEWKKTLSGFCMPLEQKSSELKQLLGILPAEKSVYGRIPMMITANCVSKTTDKCVKGNGVSERALIDRYHKTFPVELNCIHCMNIIYNSVPLSLHGELSKWAELVTFRLDFTLENEKETKEIIDYFTALRRGNYRAKDERPPYGEYTTGHERRGVE